MQSAGSFLVPPMDLSRPFSFPAFPFLARLFLLLPRAQPRAAAREADELASNGPAPASLHHDLGLPPADATPPDAQALRHDLLSHGGLW